VREAGEAGGGGRKERLKQEVAKMRMLLETVLVTEAKVAAVRDATEARGMRA
jgi:hypothetical protein